MDTSYPPQEGDTYRYERTFTHGDVEQFSEVTGDDQAIHSEPDEEGRLVVQGLLTASLQTKIGGDLSVLARAMEFYFRRPVYTGETIHCEWVTDSVEEREDRYDIEVAVECARERDDETVLTAEVTGIIWKQ
ncbi:MaoC/PaaZ C-terminal domain-containing protein [Halomarina litorea]|uniref:MaoC/PaaZ C-terminal domain-containing protein n=1 Tax=Halomarina litorea TaxID=2961595 RepID=UPI0020C21CEB|nr:MaoC/PaaZ C-terminal domain-containing protein [Halomarina sp. BCD28]